MEPGDGDDVRAALESLERRRSSSNGSDLQAASELFERQRLAGGAGAPRTATVCGRRRSFSDGNGLRAAPEFFGWRQRLRPAAELSGCGASFPRCDDGGEVDGTGRWTVSALSLPPIYKDGRGDRGAVSGNR